MNRTEKHRFHIGERVKVINWNATLALKKSIASTRSNGVAVICSYTNRDDKAAYRAYFPDFQEYVSKEDAINKPDDSGYLLPDSALIRWPEAGDICRPITPEEAKNAGFVNGSDLSNGNKILMHPDMYCLPEHELYSVSPTDNSHSGRAFFDQLHGSSYYWNWTFNMVVITKRHNEDGYPHKKSEAKEDDMQNLFGEEQKMKTSKPDAAKADQMSRALVEVLEKYMQDDDKVSKEEMDAFVKDQVEIVAQKATEEDQEILKTVYELEKKLSKKVDNLRPVQVKIADRPKVEITERVHMAFAETLEVIQLEGQAFLYGPKGSGKTTLAGQVAKSYTLPFAHISCSAGMSEGHILGRMLADGSYVETDFVRLFENGGVFLFDEVDAADANLLLVINSALANGILSIPNRKDKPYAERHKDFICIAAANTLGNGSFEYHGRNYLDAAFMDRFVMSKISVDYDKELEGILLTDAKLCAILWQIRANAQKHKLKDKVLSTRVFKSAAKAIAVGKSYQHIIDRIMLGWTEEEKKKALEDLKI